MMKTLAAPALLSLLALGACATDHTPGGNPNALTPSERYSIEVRPAPLELKLATHASGLSDAQQEALADFVHRWMLTEGAADIAVKAPEHAGDPASAYRTATDARDFLIDHGVSPGRVRIAGYDAAGDEHAPVTVSFMRYQAQGPVCGQWGNLSAVGDNHEYANFGCSVTANMAAQIANPADVLTPRASAPGDAARRETVLEKYRSGALTSAPKDDEADATFSQLGK